MRKFVQVISVLGIIVIIALSAIFAVVKVNKLDENVEGEAGEYMEEVLFTTPTSTPTVVPTQGVDVSVTNTPTPQPTNTPTPIVTLEPIGEEELELVAGLEIFEGMAKSTHFLQTGEYVLDTESAKDFVEVNNQIVKFLQTGQYKVKTDLVTSAESFSLYTDCNNQYSYLDELMKEIIADAVAEPIITCTAIFLDEDIISLSICTTGRSYIEELDMYELVYEVTTTWEVCLDGTVRYCSLDFMY